MTAKAKVEAPPKLGTVKDLIKSVRDTYGASSIMQLGGSGVIENIPAISTGALSLDKALGIGGYPIGRITEIFGPESAGKSTLCLHAIAETQKAGGLAAYIDAEHAFDPKYAEALGVRLKDLLMSQPDYGEQALNIADDLVESGIVDLIVVDSVAALVPKVELDGEMGAHHVGVHARLMSQALRKLAGACNRTKTTIIFVNQIRHKIGIMFGSPETTTGGNALKFYASVRLDVRRREQLKEGEDAVGNHVQVKVVKNKVAIPFQEADLDVRWGTGIDRVGDIIAVGISCGVVEKSGSWLSFKGERIAQGFNNAGAVLRDTPVRLQEIETAVRKAVGL
jgi:recombination protein RecA